MPAKLTQESAVAKAREIHGELYDLSKLVYTVSKAEVQVGCSKHGFFSICYRDFTKSVGARGCQVCGKELYDDTKADVHNKIGETTAIERMTQRYAGKFDYSKVVYKSYSEPVAIVCPIHGEFSMSPLFHMSYHHGCSDCAVDAVATLRLNSKEENVAKARAVFGDTYDYSEVPDGICTKTPFTLSCKIHGRFTKTWNEHTKGVGHGGCPACAKEIFGCGVRSNSDEFKVKAERVHGNLYDYSLVNYEYNRVPVDIICKVHGVFRQQPQSHLNGCGCNACAKNGFRINSPGSLYVLKSGDITKVGITNRPVNTRLRELNNSGKGFKVGHTVHFESGQQCLDTEGLLLKLLRAKYERPIGKFKGHTEAFMNVDRKWLYDQIGILGEEYA